MPAKKAIPVAAPQAQSQPRALRRADPGRRMIASRYIYGFFTCIGGYTALRLLQDPSQASPDGSQDQEATLDALICQ